MVEKIGHVKNPLTVIAIFAGLAEISGTVVLPFVAPEIQDTYIWFLMTFPFFLVGVFFLTLHTNPTSLYSPSDYKNEENFVKSVRKSTPQELTTKLQQEVAEVELDINNEPSSLSQEPIAAPTASTANSEAPDEKQIPTTVIEVSDDVRKRVASDVAAAERLAVNHLSVKLGLIFQTDVHVQLGPGKSMYFDAFTKYAGAVHCVEIKYFATSTIDVTRFYKPIEDAYEAAKFFNSGNLAFVLHLFIVSDADSQVVARAEARLSLYAARFGVDIQVHAARLSDLVNEYSIS